MVLKLRLSPEVTESITCTARDAPMLEGASVSKLEIGSCFFNEPETVSMASVYIAPFFRIHAVEYMFHGGFYFHWFYMSRLPHQPKCQSIRCQVLIQFEFDEGFYQNIFSELSEAFPNLQSLTLAGTVNCSRFDDLELTFLNMTCHLMEFSIFANIKTAMSIEINCETELIRNRMRDEIFDFFSEVSGPSVKAEGRNVLVYEFGVTRCQLEFAISRNTVPMDDYDEEYF